MKKFLIEVKYLQLVEAEDEQEAREQFFADIENESQQTLESWLNDNLKIKTIPLDEKKEGETK